LSIWYRYGDMAVGSSSRKALPGTEVGRQSVGPQYYTDLIYVFFATLALRNVAREK